MPKKLLSEFIKSQRGNSVFILAKGNLETYLPDGYRGKDVDKLIRFLNEEFWAKLSDAAKEELTDIAKALKSA